MNRMEYYNSIYDKFWQRQTHRYGVTEYEKVVLNSILKKMQKMFFLVQLELDGQQNKNFITTESMLMVVMWQKIR